jgi:hypothetical protein
MVVWLDGLNLMSLWCFCCLQKCHRSFAALSFGTVLKGGVRWMVVCCCVLRPVKKHQHLLITAADGVLSGSQPDEQPGHAKLRPAALFAAPVCRLPGVLLPSQSYLVLSLNVCMAAATS